jgi:hypothetical protein
MAAVTDELLVAKGKGNPLSLRINDMIRRHENKCIADITHAQEFPQQSKGTQRKHANQNCNEHKDQLNHTH